MGLIIQILYWLAGLGLAVIASLLANDLYYSLSNIQLWFIRFASQRLPPELRDPTFEQWTADLNDLPPSQIWRLLFAIDCVRGAIAIRQRRPNGEATIKHGRTSRRQRIALVANTSWYLYNFRLPLMKALRDVGHEVVAVAPEDAYSCKLVDAGFPHHHIPLDLTSINPFRALQSILRLRRLLREKCVDAVLSFTPKGNIYSGLALSDASVTFVPNLSGVGQAFSDNSLLLKLATLGFKWAFQSATAVLFQNSDDLHLLVKRGIVDAAKGRLYSKGDDQTYLDFMA